MSPRSRPSPVLLAWTVPAAAWAWGAARAWPYVNDDAYITLRYSRFLAAGRGPYFNPGEHVEGYTNPLTMLLNALAILLFGAGCQPLAAKLLSAAAGLGAVILAGLLARQLARRHLDAAAADLAGVFAATVTAIHPGFVTNATSGLETTLFALLVVALAGRLVTLDGRTRLDAHLVTAAIVLCRPEGLLFAGLLLAGRFVLVPADRGAVRRLAVTAVVVVLAHVALRWLLYDGELVPNTFNAKSGGFYQLAGWPYLAPAATVGYFGVIGVALAALGWWRRPAALRGVAPMIPAAATGALIPLVTGADWMIGWRIVMHGWPPLAALLTVSWTALVTGTPIGRHRLAPWGAALVLVVALVVLGRPWAVEFEREIAVRAYGYETGHAALADWLHDTVPAGGTVALMDIGIVGYRNPQLSILDISGLTDRFVARQPGRFLEKVYDPAYVIDRKPDVVVLVESAPGIAYEAPATPPDWQPWTTIEKRLFDDPRFAAVYRRPPAGPPPDAWPDRLTARFGAERVFEHAYPGYHYILAAFTRR